MFEDLVELNNRIRDMNRQGNQSMQVHRAPTYHTWGLKSEWTHRLRQIRPRRLLEGVRAHAHHDWREDKPWEQLHLSDETRIRMGKAACRYFQAIYGILD